MRFAEKMVFTLFCPMRVPAVACKLFAIAALVLQARAAAPEPGLRLEASRNEIYIGESFTLRVRVQNARNSPQPDLSALAAANVVFLGSHDASSRSIVWSNGRISQAERIERIYDYQVTPLTSGVFVAGPVSLALPDGALKAEGPVIRVTDVHDQDLVKLSVSASRSTVLLDEEFEISLVIRIRALPAPYAEYEPLLPAQPPRLNVPFLNPDETPGLQKPNLTTLLDGYLVRRRSTPGFNLNRYTVSRSPFGGFFNLDPFGEPDPACFALPRRDVRDNGRDYVEYYLTLTNRATEEGTYTFGPLEFKGRVPVGIGQGGRTETEDVFAVGAACTVRAVPPPEQGRPDAYIGTLGSDLNAKISLDTDSCRVGDPITLTMRISGNARIDKIMPPRLGSRPGFAGLFEVYDDSVQTERENGNISFVYTLRPQKEGNAGIPPIALAYFNTNTREYETVYTDPLALNVEHSDAVTAEHVVGGNTNQTAAHAQLEDHRALSIAAPWLTPGGGDIVSLRGGGLVVFVLLAGPAFFMLAVLIRARRDGRISRRERRRRRRALVPALAGIKSAEHAWEQDVTAAAIVLCGVLREFLANRFSATASGATPEDARRMLEAVGAPAEATTRFCLVYGVLFEAGFAGLSAPSIKEKPDFAELRRTLTELDAAVDSARQPRAALKNALFTLIFACIPFAMLAATLASQDASARNFLWQEANTRMAKARSPEEFQEAAQIYEQLAAIGAKNAPLFYNLGTALLQAGHAREAVAALERAERYQGTHPDLARNLDVAMARVADAKSGVMPWNRTFFFWHYRLACPLRTWIATIAYAFCWFAGAMRLLFPRLPGIRTLIAVAVLIVACFGSSVVASLHQDAAATTRQAKERSAF